MISIWRGARMLLACMLLLAASACDDDIPDDLLLPEARRHAAGLVAYQPTGFDVLERPDGFRFQEDGMIRAPRILDIWMSDTPPEVDADGRRRLPGGSAAAYAILRHEGGMGGPEYELIAWRPAGNRWIVASERVQSEWGEPDYVIVWAVLDRARIEDPEK